MEVKKVTCPKCWKENSKKNNYCFYCKTILQDIDEITEKPTKKRQKFRIRKKALLVISIVLIVSISSVLIGFGIYSSYHNSFGSDYDVEIEFNESNLIFTFNLTVNSEKTKFTTIIITNPTNNNEIAKEKINQIIEEGNSLVVALKVPTLPTTEFVNIQINNIRGHRNLEYYFNAEDVIFISG